MTSERNRLGGNKIEVHTGDQIMTAGIIRQECAIAATSDIDHSPHLGIPYRCDGNWIDEPVDGPALRAQVDHVQLEHLTAGCINVIQCSTVNGERQCCWPR